MIIGVPKEVKDHESRVGITPAGVKSLVDAGHTALVETQAGDLSAFSDDDYQSAGAEIVGSAYNVWGHADMIVKVKEPIEKEYGFFREGLVLFTYLHLAPFPELTDHLLASKVTGIAYETIRDRAGTLPLLTPMSEVAGRMSVQVGIQGEGSRYRHSAARRDHGSAVSRHAPLCHPERAEGSVVRFPYHRAFISRHPPLYPERAEGLQFASHHRPSSAALPCHPSEPRDLQFPSRQVRHDTGFASIPLRQTSR